MPSAPPLLSSSSTAAAAMLAALPGIEDVVVVVFDVKLHFVDEVKDGCGP